SSLRAIGLIECAERARSSEWPSAGALATALEAITAEPPGRFSTTNGWPRRSDIFGCSTLAIRSVGSPGAEGSTRVTGRQGKIGCRWGIAARVKEAGTPPDYPHTAMYLTSLRGHLIARIERPQHGSGRQIAFTPEPPQRCNQIWFDPVLRERAEGFSNVRLRY